MFYKYLFNFILIFTLFSGFRIYNSYKRQVPYHSLPPYITTINLSKKVSNNLYISDSWKTKLSNINGAFLTKIDNTTAKFEIKTIDRYSNSIFQPFSYLYNLFNGNYDLDPNWTRNGYFQCSPEGYS